MKMTVSKPTGSPTTYRGKSPKNKPSVTRKGKHKGGCPSGCK